MGTRGNTNCLGEGWLGKQLGEQIVLGVTEGNNACINFGRFGGHWWEPWSIKTLINQQVLLVLAGLVCLLCFPGPFRSSPGGTAVLVELGFETLKLVKVKPALVTFCLVTRRLGCRVVAGFEELDLGGG